MFKMQIEDTTYYDDIYVHYLYCLTLQKTCRVSTKHQAVF
jgi:hypothetical protein